MEILRSFSHLKIAIIFLYIYVLLIYPSPACAQRDLSALYKKVVPSVVLIITFDTGGKPQAQGTGFFVGEEGILVTNFHVIEGAARAVAKLSTGEVLPIEGILSENRETDLALLRVGVKGRSFPAIKLQESKTEIGQPIAVVGNPLGLERTITDGIISSVRYSDKNGKIIQISAPISHGSSGSPVVNMDGSLVGVATASQEGGQNLNFAVSVDMVSELISYRQNEARQFASSADIPQAETYRKFIQDNLPRSYSGTYQWRYKSPTQEVFINIPNISADSSGNVIADGSGKYRSPSPKGTGIMTTIIDVKLQITPDTLRFEMWEMNPQSGTKSNFNTNGSHIGTISKDLRTIKAVWTTQGSGKQGDLLLRSN